MNKQRFIVPTCRAHAYAISLMLLTFACAQQQSSSGADAASQSATVTPQNSNTVATLSSPLTAATEQNPNANADNANVTAAANNSNVPLANGNDVAITATKTVALPAIGFNDIPVDDKLAVALTFDDGPDGTQGATDMVLDTLKKEGLKATFFICANMGFAQLATDPVAQRQLKRIVAEGHAIGNHTYAHKDLATLTTNADLEAAFSQLDAVYKKVLGPTAPVITTIRAPFGSPFQLDPNQTARVAPVVTKWGVQVGWGMDPKDWSFDHFSTDPTVFNADVKAVIDSVQTLITNKQWGAILLHAVHLPSATALPTVIAMFRAAGYHFVSVEDVIRSQYGANSASIMAANNAALAAGQAL